jgi:hypothetical protein
MMGYKHAFYNPFYCMENTLYDSYRRPGACWGPVVRNQCIGIDAKHRSVGGSPTSTRIAFSITHSSAWRTHCMAATGARAHAGDQ